MKHSRLIRQLSCLSPAEIKRFSDFVEVPFFGFSSKTTKLAKYLIALYPDFPAQQVEKKRVFKWLFPSKQPFFDQAVHDQFSLVNKCFQRFLAYTQFEQDEAQKQLYVLKAYAEKRDPENALRTLGKAEKIRHHPHAFSPNGHLQLFSMYQEANKLQAKRSLKKGNDHLAMMVSQLDQFYLISKLKYACEMLNRQTIFNIAYDQQWTQILVDQLTQNAAIFPDNPLISIYHQIYRLLQSPSDEGYQAIQDELELNKEKIAHEEKANMYSFLQNHCIRQLNAGHPYYLKELFLLYQTLLEEQILIDTQGFIAHPHIKNIVTVGLRLQKYEWVRDFLETYKDRIHAQHREDAFHYNLAQYHYEQKQYRQALKLLTQINYSDLFYQLDARMLQMRVYYEMEEDDSLLYLVKAFKTFLKRNQELSKRQYAPYENLLQLAQKAYRLKIKQGSMPQGKYQEKLEKLQQTIASTQAIANLHWLKRKVQELEEG